MHSSAIRKALCATALLFVAAMVVNTIIALHYRWPAMFDAPGNPDTIMTDFILYGTRISPPVMPMLVVAIAGLLALKRSNWGIAATLVVMAFSALVSIAGAGEPAGLPPHNIPRALLRVLGTVGAYAPLLMIALGAAELARRLIARRKPVAP